MEEDKKIDDEFAGAVEVESNWFKFLKVGDSIKGTLLSSTFVKSSNDIYPDQFVYKLKKSNGEEWNVGISINKKGTIDRLNKCQPGDIIGIRFESEGKSAIKGGKPSKNLKVFKFGIDPTFGGEEIDVDKINFD